MARRTIAVEEEKPEPVKTSLELEEDRMVQLRNEKRRLEKEIDLLMVRYEDRQRMFQEQDRAFKERQRTDIDKITAQLYDNKMLQERLIRTQSEVNQMRVKIEHNAESQKKILLEKEVQLDQELKKVAELKAQYAAQLKGQ